MSDFKELVDEMVEQLPSGVIFKPKALQNANNKWFVRSAMQKAIRRGRVDEAMSAASYLYGTEPTYAWHSLNICVVEDIGLGDPDLLAWSTLFGAQSILKHMDSPPRMFGALLVRACEGIKTRSCCELSFSEYAEKELRAIVSKEGTEALVEHLFDPTEQMPLQHLAAVQLRKRSGRKDKDLMMRVLSRMMEVSPDEKLARAAMLTFERFHDTMNLATFPLVQHFYGTKDHPASLEVTVIDDEFPEEKTIKGFSSSALDMHVSAGKKAIKAFYTSTCKRHDLMQDFGKRTDDVVKALGALIFVVEGGQVVRRIVNPEFASLKRYQDRTLCVEYGCPDDLYKEMIEFVRSNIATLNEKRAWAIDA